MIDHRAAQAGTRGPRTATPDKWMVGSLDLSDGASAWLAEVAWSRARVHLVHRLLCPVCAWQDGAGDRATCRAPRMDYSTMYGDIRASVGRALQLQAKGEGAVTRLLRLDRASFGSRSAYGSVRLPFGYATSPDATAARDEKTGPQCVLKRLRNNLLELPSQRIRTNASHICPKCLTHNHRRARAVPAGLLAAVGQELGVPRLGLGEADAEDSLALIAGRLDL